jgi:phosphoglycolate phosphatase-like HAD superfamily hydrolase
MRLLLFDVDGTLLRCGPQVRPILVDTLREVYGVAELRLDGYDFSGKTDQQIVLELVELAGLARAEALERLPWARDVYLAHLEARLDRGLMEVLPGVEELLGELARHAGVALGLLTGNWEAGARIKLSRFGLERFFPFGAYGDDAVERSELLPVALERARRATGRRFAPEEVLIVGDSCRDVACGLAHGVPVLAVTTGWTPAERLTEAGAHRVVASLAGLAAELAG